MIYKNQKIYDVIVVGAGAAGVAAAIGAANTGAKTLLIERNPYFGGQATHSIVPTYCGFFTQSNPPEQIVGGIGQLVLDKLSKLGCYTGPKRTPNTGTSIVPLDMEATKFALDQCLLESPVEALLHATLIAVEVHDCCVYSITCATDGGKQIFEASAFVDASGEANLAALSGGGCRIGDYKGIFQAATLVYRIGGVTLSADAHPLKVQTAICKAKAAGIPHLTKELGTVIRMPEPSRDVIAMLADEDANGLDAWNLTQCEISGRRQAWAYLEAFRHYLPGFENAYLVQTGPQIGIRETRHIIGEDVVTQDDVLNARRYPDAIACGGWPIELHPEPGRENVWLPIKDQSYYHIPLGALKPINLKNVWAGGRIISCDPYAFASVRVMGTGFATGHAAGVAAALQQDSTYADIRVIRKELMRQGAIL